MADGTIRCYIDIDMHCKDDFLANFPIDAPIAVARITQEAATASAQSETIERSNRLTGLALWAAEKCKDQDFLTWLKLETSYIAESESDARLAILDICDIQSRRELETDRRAIAVFNHEIRGPFMKWLEETA